MRKEDFAAAWERLTPREREVLRCIAEDGMENAEAAGHLGIKPLTLETHRANGLHTMSVSLKAPMKIRKFTACYWRWVVNGKG